MTDSNKPQLKRCILKGVELTPDVDSRAHIINSALGGRLKPKGILSRLANKELDEKFDNELKKAYQPFMVLVKGQVDRREVPLLDAVDDQGNPYKIGAEEIRLGEFQIDHEKGTIATTSMQQMEQLLAKVKKDHPELNIDIQEKLSEARLVQAPAPVLTFEMQFGPRSTFPAIFVVSALFASHHEIPHHPAFVNYVNSFDVQTRELPPDTFYFVHEDLFESPALVGHTLILFCDSKRKQALFYAELFNQPGIAVTLPYGGASTQSFTYGVDVMEGKNVDIQVNQQKLLTLDWQQTHTNGPELWKIVEERGNAIASIAMLRSIDSMVDELKQNALDAVLQKCPELGEAELRRMVDAQFEPERHRHKQNVLSAAANGRRPKNEGGSDV